MFNPVKLKENLYWVGAIDWNIRTFHGFTYSTHSGTTYNSYLLVDDKVALIDGVHANFFEEWRQRLSRVIDPAKIDYFICNHVEPDHSGAIPQMMKLMPKSKLVTNQRAKDALLKYYFTNTNGKDSFTSSLRAEGEAIRRSRCEERSDEAILHWDFQIVKTGDKLNLGKKTLSFIEAPMIHWPDSMFDYLEEDGILFSNDAFGQHYASIERFDDEVRLELLMDENAKYYANILWPLSPIILKKLNELKNMNIPLKMILTSHGLSWRKYPEKAIESYTNWAKGKASTRSVIVVYDTMYSSSEKMALAILEGIRSEGLNGRLYRLPVSDIGDIIKEFLDTRGILIGSSVINNGILPTVEKFLFELKGLRPLNKIAAFFGSYGWMKDEALKYIEETMKEAGINIALPELFVRYAPSAEELNQCFAFGQKFAALS